jgi:hypothetical protein
MIYILFWAVEILFSKVYDNFSQSELYVLSWSSW